MSVSRASWQFNFEGWLESPEDQRLTRVTANETDSVSLMGLLSTFQRVHKIDGLLDRQCEGHGPSIHFSVGSQDWWLIRPKTPYRLNPLDWQPKRPTMSVSWCFYFFFRGLAISRTEDPRNRDFFFNHSFDIFSFWPHPLEALLTHCPSWFVSMIILLRDIPFYFFSSLPFHYLSFIPQSICLVFSLSFLKPKPAPICFSL